MPGRKICPFVLGVGVLDARAREVTEIGRLAGERESGADERLRGNDRGRDWREA